MDDADHVRDRIIRAARHALVAGEAVDVGKVAGEVGVDRTTVFRQVGRRDLLLAEALWRVTADFAWPSSLAAHPAGTPHRAAEVLRTYTHLLVGEAWFRSFLHRDPQRALRILTTSATPVQARAAALVEELVAGEPRPPVDIAPGRLAFLAVRIVESFAYTDLIAGGTPDADAAYPVLVALLG